MAIAASDRAVFQGGTSEPEVVDVANYFPGAMSGQAGKYVPGTEVDRGVGAIVEKITDVTAGIMRHPVFRL